MKLLGMEWLICDVVRLQSNLPLLLKYENDFDHQGIMKFATEIPDV